MEAPEFTVRSLPRRITDTCEDRREITVLVRDKRCVVTGISVTVKLKDSVSEVLGSPSTWLLGRNGRNVGRYGQSAKKIAPFDRAWPTCYRTALNTPTIRNLKAYSVQEPRKTRFSSAPRGSVPILVLQ